jgi:hypothetical protein
MATQNLLGIVGRSVIIDDVPLNEFVVMQKKEGQHISLVPAARIKIYLHWWYVPKLWRGKRAAAIRCVELQSRNLIVT